MERRGGRIWRQSIPSRGEDKRPASRVLSEAEVDAMLKQGQQSLDDTFKSSDSPLSTTMSVQTDPVDLPNIPVKIHKTSKIMIPSPDLSTAMEFRETTSSGYGSVNTSREPAILKENYNLPNQSGYGLDDLDSKELRDSVKEPIITKRILKPAYEMRPLSDDLQTFLPIEGQDDYFGVLGHNSFKPKATRPLIKPRNLPMERNRRSNSMKKGKSCP